jgi:hypothetical protein
MSAWCSTTKIPTPDVSRRTPRYSSALISTRTETSSRRATRLKRAACSLESIPSLLNRAIPATTSGFMEL